MIPTRVHVQAFTPHPTPRGAFTLSELLISLAVLGLIAAFAIPGILTGLDKNQRKSRFNEAFSVIANVVQTGVASGEFSDTGNITYLSQNLNPQKFCTNAQLEGCWGASDTAENSPTAPALLLHTTVAITDIETQATGADRYYIDVNGAAEPNLRCEDQFPIVVSLRQNSTFDGVTLRLGEVKRSSVENGYPATSSCTESQFPGT